MMGATGQIRRRPRAAAAFAMGALLALTACGAPSESESDPDSDSTSLTIYAAASLQAAFSDLLAEFADAHPEIVVEPVVYDGSSTLVTQLTEGAAADVFASADEANMEDLVAEGLARSEPVLFAGNTLVIAVAPGNPEGIADLEDLEDVDYVICAPAVPCGAATVELFAARGVTSSAVSEEQNVTSVAERVAGGEVDAGLVYATDVVSRSDVLEAVVPTGADEVINRYPVVALTETEATTAFIDFLLSDQGQAVLAEYGFVAP